ncbi:MAG TPA: acetyl-CoA C-acyltransferase FadI [Kofleriaceae bacterium]|jgi:acetyl-CoA acyltransferase|nr:acetyl-CoA C-acyltransferase FadI [Kofleriaceae bacterium]
MTSTRVALVAGLRTPFARQASTLRHASALDLGAAVVKELVARTGTTNAIERVVFGQVLPSLRALNIAREAVLDAGLRPDVDAYSVARACATGYQAAADVVHAIRAGDIEIGIAGGADSASDIPIAVSKPLAAALVANDRARSIADRVRAFKHLSPRDLLPEPPTLVERTTGLTMGEHAEAMAYENGITRAAQDEYAHRSHVRAAAAWADGRFAGEVVPIGTVTEDNCVRKRGTVADYAALRPVFDRAKGTITAGNSSPLTDGASAGVFMREDRARALGHAPIAYVRAIAFTALDPRGQMLMGPAYAIPKVLARAGVAWRDLALVDLHEAFAAQVLSVTQAIESKAWAAAHLGASAAIGSIDWDRFNVMGGSIALGHPFAATGMRQVTQLARELGRRGGGLGLAAACAAGGLGAAIVLEVET